MPKPADDLWIWVHRWNDFQHYRPDPSRGPAWIKLHTAQLDDDRYTDLPPRARALLHDVRMTFARTRGQLSANTRVLSRRCHQQVFRTDLESLSHAGFIEIVSRATLEQRLEKFYSSPRAAARSREVEVEVEVPEGLAKGTSTPPTPGNGDRPAHVWQEHDEPPDLTLITPQLRNVS